MRERINLHLYKFRVLAVRNRVKGSLLIVLGGIGCVFLAFNVAKNAFWEYLDGNELYHATRSSDWVKAS